jgi:hypothetical protein
VKGEEKIPLVVITDLYHPHHDPGDNVELINAYEIQSFDLKAVILDCYNPFRKKHATGVNRGLLEDPYGPREPGIICVQQLNYIYGRSVPFGIGPFEQMKHKNDQMCDLSNFFNQGIDLLKKTLEKSDEPVTIASFGSARVLAVAYNRFPDLMKKKTKMIHLSAGTGGNESDYLEWNVALDTLAFVSLIESGLPLALYPCAAGRADISGGGLINAFTGDIDNTYYKLESLAFIETMHPKLRQYLHFVFDKKNDVDFLGYLDKSDPIDAVKLPPYHHVWESAVWMNIANLRLVKSASGEVKIKPKKEINKDDVVFREELLNCDISVSPCGVIKYNLNPQGKYLIYMRDDPAIYQEWMNMAIPSFYSSFLKD